MTSLGTILSENARSLVALMPAVRDGAPEAIHDARVATRRIRAALDLVGHHRPEPHLDEAAAIARRIARTLGRARDIDVSLELLDDLERRVPAAAHGAGVARGNFLRQRTSARRDLVRKVDARLTRCRSTHCQLCCRSGCRTWTRSSHGASASEQARWSRPFTMRPVCTSPRDLTRRVSASRSCASDRVQCGT